MTKVRFLQDYRGHLSGENFYPAGSLAEFAEAAALALAAAGRAEIVEDAPEIEPESKAHPGPPENKLAAPPATNKRKGKASA